MTPSNEMCPICSYAGSAQYCEWPSAEQIRQGVVPLDSLPAAWWNNMWADATNRINEARDMIGQVITEINNVLENAGICAASACTDQLYQSINKIRQVLATNSIPGAVVSSSVGGAVCVANDGTMSVNCLGNVAALTTTAHTVVGAVNELNTAVGNLNTCTSNLNSGKAPNNHASADTTYGVGNATNYGHVKLSDTYSSCVGAAADGIAASQKALYDMYTCITSAGYVTLGNTVGCALGTASAGSASTAARSDHVHPMPDTGSLTGMELTLGKKCSAAGAGIIKACGYQATYDMVCFLNNTSDAYGNGYSIGGGGVGILGAGEGASSLWSWLNGSSALYGSAAGNETLYLASDGEICFFTNTQNGAASACKTRISSNGYYYGNVCGNVCGTASSAGYATSAGSATNATNACCATCARCILNSAGTAAYCIYIS